MDCFTFKDGAPSYLLFCRLIAPDCGLTEAIDISRLTDKPLIIAGAIHDEPYFSAEIAPLLDEKHIRYVGPVTPETRNQLFGSALALLHPTSCDAPFDFSVLEANACGTPVVAFTHDLLSEIITEGINGFMVPDAQAAADAIQRIRAISRAQCRKLAEERLSQHRMVDEYLRVYERVLAKTHTEDRRPWGYYVVLSDQPDHKVKRIVVCRQETEPSASPPQIRALDDHRGVSHCHRRQQGISLADRTIDRHSCGD